MAAAQDTGGEQAAGQYYDRAKARFTTLLDPTHAVTRAFGMVNVPSAVWIDENGRLVRPPETAWTKRYQFGGIAVGEEPYADALRDWAAKGAQSTYTMSADELRAALKPRNPQRPLADAHFALAVHLHRSGRAEEAAAPFLEAQRLDPDNWNFHRQAWAFDPTSAAGKFFKKFQALEGKPYYEPPAIKARDEGGPR